MRGKSDRVTLKLRPTSRHAFVMTRSASHQEPLLSAALLRWMNDLAGQGILVTDADLNVRAWNHWLEEHSELGADEVLGRNLLEIYTELEKRRLDRH